VKQIQKQRNKKMKFKNEDHKFEWEVLDLNEKEYIQKIKFLKPFQESVENLFEFDQARDKWNSSTNGKRFKEKILNSLNILEKDDYEFSDVLEIFKSLSSIATHIFIELEYYEPNKKMLKEFLKVSEIFLNNYSILLKSFSEIILNPNKLNNYKEKLIEIFNYFKDF
jgi:hypothetical protein